MINKPSVKTFYFGADREVDVPTKSLSLPSVKDLPIPNATWKDCHLEISQPFEGELHVFCSMQDVLTVSTKEICADLCTEKQGIWTLFFLSVEQYLSHL